MNEGPRFERYIGVDYSGAETPASSLRGLRAYSAGRTMPASEVPPPPGPRKYWTRRGLAEWLANLLSRGNTYPRWNRPWLLLPAPVL